MTKGEPVPGIQMARKAQLKLEEAEDEFGKRRPKRQPSKNCSHRWEYDEETRTHECVYCGEEKA